MDIVSVPFEEPLVISIQSTIVKLIPFKTVESGVVKFGIEAPRSINIHREEIYQAIKSKHELASS